jgi:hypothetical protein
MHSPNPSAAARCATHVIRRRITLSFAAALATSTGMAAAQTPTAGGQYLVYLPSTAADVDQASIVTAFNDSGYTVDTFPDVREDDLTYARRIAGEVRALIARGVHPEQISVVGAGSGSRIAALVSAVTGNRQVNYVLLGGCDLFLKQQYTFHMSGRVLGIRDVADPRSHSCRPLWQGSPKLGDRRDMALRTAYGATLFERPRAEWMQPLTRWTNKVSVEIGELHVGSLTRSTPEGHGASD